MELTRIFNDRWCSQFPGTPPPDVLAELGPDCHVKTHPTSVVNTIKRAIEESERKISTLRDQLTKELFIKDTLETYAKELNKQNNSVAKLFFESSDLCNVRSVTNEESGFEQFKAELTDVCAIENNSVFAKHRGSLKHVELKDGELCGPHYDKVWIDGCRTGGDNSDKPKHLTKVNCFKNNKSILQMASESNKENGKEMEINKEYEQVLVIPSSVLDPNVFEVSADNNCLKVLDNNSDKHSEVTSAPSRPGPAVPKKPPKPLPHPRRKAFATSSLPVQQTCHSDVLAAKAQTYPKSTPSSRHWSFEPSAGDSAVLAACASLNRGCGVAGSIDDCKYKDDCLPHATDTQSLTEEGDTLFVSNGNSQLSASQSECTMRKFHRNKSDKKQNGDGVEFPCVQGTYRKIGSSEVIVDECVNQDKADRMFPCSADMKEYEEDCVDGNLLLVYGDQNTASECIQNNTCSSLLDNVLFFKEDEVEERAKPSECVYEMEDKPVMRNVSKNVEEKFLDEDQVDGEFETNEETFEKNHSRVPSYENWTIDRCVTLPRFDDSNESEAGDDMYDNVNVQDSPLSTVHKYNSYKGSKDSGLCDDLSVSETQAGGDSASACHVRYSEFPPPPQLLLRDNSDDSSDSDDSESNKQSDSGSVASDIVFIPASELKQQQSYSYHNVSAESQGDQDSLERIQKVFTLPRHHLQQSPVLSSGDDEVASSESCDEIDTSHDESPQVKMLKLRQILVAGVLDSEKSYLSDLELLLTYKRSLLASSHSSQPVIRQDDIEAIFSNIDILYQVHVEFVTGLKPIVNSKSMEQRIGEIFKMLIFKLPVYGEYMENYQKAVSKIHRCCEESQRFQEIAQAIKLPSNNKEVTNLEDALFKPVQRLQRNTLVLHDLIKYTPESHPDHEILKKTLSLSQHNLETFGTGIMSSGALPEEKRYLVKSSFLVELVNGSRKLRYMFLFNDILVCTKKETHRRSNSFICKWFTPLCQITRDTTFDYEDDQKYSWREEIEEMKRKIGNLKSDLRAELKREGSTKEKHWSIGGMAAARSVEKLKKKIQELEASLILASPKLPVKLSHEKGKFHTLLMTTDYEREEWMEAMTLLCKKCANTEPPSLSAYDVQELVNSVKEQPQVNKLGSVLMQNDEDMFNGTLNVTIHKLNGLNRKCDTYCCLEMDSYDHFFMKARSHICPASSDPSWDEDFELELDGSQTLRVLVYEKRKDKSDELLGRGAMELNKSWLNQTFQERTVVLNEVSLVISVRHTPANKTMRRIPSQQKTAVFGVKISTCTKREGKTVPTIVTTCIQEVEKRGLDEIGIYRVSGVTSEVQKLKKMFDKNVRAACNIVGDSDIHAVTGVLKLYFRELPEPLFTEANYSNFIDALKLADSETRERLMISLLHDLPAANYYTIVTMIEHLVRVTKYEKENKMTTHNLSTVFGPTLLAPAVKDTQLNPMEMMSKGAEAVLQESAVIGFFLDIAAAGKSLRKSAKC